MGYGEGKDAIFYETALIPGKDYQPEELGLVTNKITDNEGNTKLVIFVPGVPNPTTGRLVVIDRNLVKPLAMSVNETLKALVLMGKTEINIESVKKSK